MMISGADNNQGADGGPKLTDVFVCELMRETHPLRLMLHRLPVHYRVLELFYDGFVDSVTLCQIQYVQ